MSTLTELLTHLTFSSLLDILLVALLFFALFYLIQGTRAVQLLRGVMLVVSLAVLASNLFHLTAFSWLIRNSIPALLVAIPVIFQPELRRALERIGRGRLFTRPVTLAVPALSAVARSAQELAKKRWGALIVLEGATGLQEYIDTGVLLDAKISEDLLLAIFSKNAALHDGAVIIRADRIIAATCTLPLSENSTLDRDSGTRHRAAVGITEGTDATAIVVSEETGQISVAHSGRLVRRLDEGELNRVLLRLYKPIENANDGFTG
ncbi:MAG: TIGR00159 family protein [Chloroflexi bacterium]|nr:TIGR00159 family protein [Chloroflexota bacterium]MBI3741162.1 TIGR00159 family protein [Chloroflexota bacterium]